MFDVIDAGHVLQRDTRTATTAGDYHCTWSVPRTDQARHRMAGMQVKRFPTAHWFCKKGGRRLFATN